VSLADLVLALADNKQLLGLRYAEWAIRAPSLEADIAAAAMGLDELGHSRVLYGCLDPVGADPRGPDREADPGTYRNLPYFDRPWTEWSQFVAANAVLDTAFTALVQACVEGNVDVLRSRLRKMLQEERYHFLHGRSWLREGSSSVDEASLAAAIEESCACPGGRLTVVKDGKPIDPALPQEIGLIQDSLKNCRGPLWVKGGITIEGADGKVYEKRNRVTLCRCGESTNMPFCDISHLACPHMHGKDE